MNSQPIVEVENLGIRFETRAGTVRAVDGVSFQLHPAETLGLVGESGCGKSMTARALLQMVPPPGIIDSGRIMLSMGGTDQNVNAIDVLKLKPTGRRMRQIRGSEIGMIFQEPMAALSPVHTIESQMQEAIRIHQDVSKAEARERSLALLEAVGIPDPERVLHSYSFELSGGMMQRAMIALALSANPRILIADEPTTALDVTIQAQILQLLKELQRKMGMAILLISHNLGVVATIAQRVAVMYMGQLVEIADTTTLFEEPKHPYTIGLLKSIPRVDAEREHRLWAIPGSVPDPYTVLQGCCFYSRCSDRLPGVCDVTKPTMVKLSTHHQVRCLLYDESYTSALATKRGRATSD
ncbi:MAG: ABC transporter ATP-binding protein [Firmicutes bacterium]|nr:ABC transporter ATP-binding protein [Bacillota bacterium]